MTEVMKIEQYLAQGGVLSSPENAPARYRGELMRMMSAFVDTELAASAGFASSINFSTSIDARIAASRITLEKAQHAKSVLAIMGSFGTDVERYQQHDWAARLPRDNDLHTDRQFKDMRLSVFYYPLENWVDAVVMNVLQGLAANVQLEELVQVSYAPLAEVLRDVAVVEQRHTDLGVEGLANLVKEGENQDQIESSVAYWLPRVAAGFGQVNSSRFEVLRQLGLRHDDNETLLKRWQDLVAEKLEPLGIKTN